ncbi:hypothetical protein ACFQO1_04580 [Jejudonia soesokkakensis]|uniref:DUF5673 domain-containing protein n=1 Tax=Jejudonia soesokkakensis TaxID=1323432 RepID=A0ABW2MT07_9FLAO
MKVFIEIQRFDQWWFRLIMGAVLLVTVIPIILSYETLAKDPTSLWLAIGTSIFTLLLFILLSFWLKLETKIDEQGIYYGFWPFHLKLKQVPWREIEKCYVRKYNPLTEYGGWGYRTGFGKKSGAMNVKGNIGIQIELSNHKKLLLGTQKEAEAKQVLETYKHKMKTS